MLVPTYLLAILVEFLILPNIRSSYPDVVGIPLIVGYQHLNIKHTLLRYYIRYGLRIATIWKGLTRA